MVIKTTLLKTPRASVGWGLNPRKESALLVPRFSYVAAEDVEDKLRALTVMEQGADTCSSSEFSESLFLLGKNLVSLWPMERDSQSALSTF